MANKERIADNNKELQECIVLAQNLPDAGGSNEFHDFLAGTLENVDFDGIETLNAYTFYGNAGIKSVRLSNVTSIGASNFQNCEALQTVDLPKLLDTTNNYFCAGSREVVNVNIPQVKKLGKFSFQNVKELQRIDLPMVDTIDTNTFGYCDRLSAVILRKSDGVVALLGGSSTFSRCYIYVPKSLLSDDDAAMDYRRATNWAAYANQFRPLENYTVDGTIMGELDEGKI